MEVVINTVIKITLTQEQQDLLFDAVAFATSVGIEQDIFSQSEIEQLLLIRNKLSLALAD